MLHIGLTRQDIRRLESLIAQLDADGAGHNDNRRATPRVDFSHSMWLSLPTNPDQPWIHIQSRNLSTGGLAFLTRNPVHAGDHLVISHELNASSPQLALCQVCFCRHVDGDIHEVGLTFVKVQPDPTRQREIPSDWLRLILQRQWRDPAASPATTSATHAPARPADPFAAPAPAFR